MTSADAPRSYTDPRCLGCDRNLPTTWHTEMWADASCGRGPVSVQYLDPAADAYAVKTLNGHAAFFGSPAKGSTKGGRRGRPKGQGPQRAYSGGPTGDEVALLTGLGLSFDSGLAPPLPQYGMGDDCAVRLFEKSEPWIRDKDGEKVRWAMMSVAPEVFPQVFGGLARRLNGRTPKDELQLEVKHYSSLYPVRVQAVA